MLLKNYKQLQTIKNNLILVEDIIPPPPIVNYKMTRSIMIKDERNNKCTHPVIHIERKMAPLIMTLQFDL